MKIVISGTHLSPSLAVAKLLRQKKHHILFLGRKHALEGDKAVSFDYKGIIEESFEFKNLITGRLQRKWTVHTLPSLLKIPIGMVSALWILAHFKPDIILSFGGYVSLPVTIAGFFLGIPVVIHEQTLGAGLANKIASLWARKVLISWKKSEEFFPKEKTILAGNPIREEILKKSHTSKLIIDDSNKNLPIIYVTGGSLGSHKINVAVEEIIDKLLKDYIIIHQTGDARQYRDFERLREVREGFDAQRKVKYFLIKYVDPGQIGWVFGRADLVVGRSGINTVSELLALGLPALLVPLPFSQGEEQTENALLLKKVGLGEILHQDELTPDKLLREIKTMIENLQTYRKNKDKAKQLINRDAAKKILEVVLGETERKNN